MTSNPSATKQKLSRKQPGIENVCAVKPGNELRERINATLPFCTIRRPFPQSTLKTISKKKDVPGEGARNIALLLGIQENHAYAFQFCVSNPWDSKQPYRSFGTAETIEHVFDSLKSIPPHKRALYEYLSLQGGTFLAADIEWYVPILEQSSEECIRAYEEQTLQTLRIGIELVLGPLTKYKGREQNTRNSRVVNVEGHNTQFLKISLHFKHTGIGFGPIIGQKSVWLEIIQQLRDAKVENFLSNHPQNKGKWLANYPFIDTHMYKKGGEMRSAYSVNVAKTNPQPLRSLEHPEFNKVNFISHAIGIHTLRNREQTLVESGISREELDDRIPEVHNITFVDTAKWDEKHKLQRVHTKPQHCHNKKLKVPFLSLDDLNDTIETNVHNDTALYQWIAQRFQGINQGFGLRPIQHKGTTYYINLTKPKATKTILCCDGVEHDHNNLCVCITTQLSTATYRAACHCFGCKKYTAWGQVPTKVWKEFQLPDFVTLRKEKAQKKEQWLHEISTSTKYI